MKLRKLPVTDLARICPLPRPQKKAELRKFGSFQPRKSYRPVRKVLPWLYDLDLPLFKLKQEVWNRVEQRIVADAPADFVDSCLEVAKLLWILNGQRETLARQFNAPPFFIGPNQAVLFGIAHVCQVAGKLVFPFVQMRRAHGLDLTGFGILCSMVREAYVFGDYERAGIEIIDLSIPRGMKRRQVRLYYAEELPRFSLNDLNEMAFEVYEVIAEIESEDKP
jgi:hypothetical protein